MKIISLKNKDDDQLMSIAIIFQFAVLITQFIFLYSICPEGTGLGSLTKLISKLSVLAVFLIALPRLLRKKLYATLIIYLTASIVIIFTLLVFPENIEYLKSSIVNLVSMCLLTFCFAFSISNISVFYNYLLKFSKYILFMGVIEYILQSIGVIVLESYNMAFSYYLLIPVLVFLNEYLNTFKIKWLLLIITAVVLILITGARGPIFSIGVYVIIYLIKHVFERKVTVKTFLYLLFIILIIVGFIFMNQILTLINNIFLQFGIHSRTIAVLLSDNLHLSGRDDLYNQIFEILKDNFFIGKGLYGDRVLLDGSYAHNLFLEILINFGMALGPIILIIIFVVLIKTLFFKDKMTCDIMLILFCLSFVPLMFSGSYLDDIWIWVYMGLGLRRTFKLN